jgi:hypothetical protein
MSFLDNILFALLLVVGIGYFTMNVNNGIFYLYQVNKN